MTKAEPVTEEEISEVRAAVLCAPNDHWTRALGRLLATIAADREKLAEAESAATKWHGICDTIAVFLELGLPDADEMAGLVRDKFDALLARVSELEKEREWHPMESAPRDGTHVEALHESGGLDLVYWSDTRYCMLGAPQGSRGPGWVSVEAEDLPVEDPIFWREEATAPAEVPTPPVKGKK